MNQLLSNRLARIAFAACMIASPIAAIADQNAAVDKSGSIDQSLRSGTNSEEPGIEGTWVSLVVSNATSPPTNVFSIVTFLPGGHIVEDTSGTTIRSASQGEWHKTGPVDYMRSMFYMSFDPPHTFKGMTRVVSLIQLNDTRNEFDAESFIEVYDVNGNLTATRINPSHARRCTIAMTMPQCMGLAP